MAGEPVRLTGCISSILQWNAMQGKAFIAVCCVHCWLALLSRMNWHLQVNLLVQEKFGFRKGIPTTNAVFTLTDNILTAID